MTENKKIEVEYLATAADYRRVLLWYRWKRLAVIIGITFLVGIPILVSAFSSDPANRPPGFVLWFLLVLPVLVLAVFYWGIYRQAERIEKIFEPVKVTFTKDGLESEGESSSAEMNWDSFYQVYETNQDFIFFPEKNIFYTIPKRFFTNAEEISEFKTLLRENLKNKAILSA